MYIYEYTISINIRICFNTYYVAIVRLGTFAISPIAMALSVSLCVCVYMCYNYYNIAKIKNITNDVCRF